MDSAKGYSEVSQEVQEGWFSDKVDSVLNKLGLGKEEKAEVITTVEKAAEQVGADTSADAPGNLGTAATTTGTTNAAATTGNKTAKEVWDEIKAKRDPLPQGPERVRLSNLMNQINVTSTTPEEAAKILAQSANRPSDAELAANTTASSSTATTVAPGTGADGPAGGAKAGTVTTTNTTANNDNPRPTENAEGDPYDIINSRQQVEAGQVGAQARLDKGLAELKADQEAWDEEFGSASTDAATNTDAATEPNTTFDSINDAMKADNLKAGDIITIDGKEAEVGETDDGQQFFVHPGSDISIDKPKPPAPQGELSATDTAQTATKTVAPGTGADGPAGGAKAPAETPPAATADPDANDPRGDQTNPPPAVAPSNGSLLGRKLDTTTPNIMKAYNDGGKQAMPTIRNMQTALSRLGFDPNGIDGKYGNGTFKAVQAFQKANGLAVDGQAGPDTMKSMKAILDKNFEKNKVTPADTANSTAPRSNASGDPAETGSTGAGTAEVPPKANSAVNTTGPAATTQFASKDNNMKKAIKESASMNVSMTADNASEVADLMKLLKNAGMDDAKPVSDIMSPPMSMEPSMPSDNMSDFVKMIDKGEKQDLPGETSCSSCGGTHEEDSCSEEYDAVIDEWDNSPEEEYKDANYMLNDLAGGINRPKKQFAKANDGDNAMAVENSIKEQLWAALNEKKADIKTTEGRGKATARRIRGKDKLMAGRGRGEKK